MHLNFIIHVVVSIFLILIRFRTVMLGVILACTVRSRISVPSLGQPIMIPNKDWDIPLSGLSYNSRKDRTHNTGLTSSLPVFVNEQPLQRLFCILQLCMVLY